MVRDHLMGRDITDRRVLEVMGEIPRELFVPPKYRSQAYADSPLPIGTGQTISQPYIVALMTQHLDLKPDSHVLEIGTGSGYQTAILAKLAAHVYTIEKYNQLSESAQAVLGRLNIENVEYCIGDGSCGWPDPGAAPFDRIIITAAIPSLPMPITDQLADEGRIVAPTGGPYEQTLTLYQNEKNELKAKPLCQCRFVKLTGKNAFPE